MDIEQHLSLRSRSLNSSDIERVASDYVLCWLQQSLRAENNPVIDAALAFADSINQPVVVLHSLGQHYPHASDRFHRFILEASRSLESGLAGRGIRFVRHIQTIDSDSKGLVYRLAAKASMLVLDDQSAFVGRWQAQTVAAKLDKLVVAVDAARLVPENALAGRYMSTRAFRARHSVLRDEWFNEPTDLPTVRPVYSGELPIENSDLGKAGTGSIDLWMKQCAIDHAVTAVDLFPGDRESALERLVWAAMEQIPEYSARRNNPSFPTTSYLSPYLHFGVLSPCEVVSAIDDSDTDARNRWRFFDELLTWREYFHHCASHQEVPSSFNNISSAARKSLLDHACDEREELFTLEQLVHGETSDELWNVAQRQFLLDGWMHNNLRMYWGKRIIGWTATPQLAWDTACYLNDRFSLDGRDPATYGNMLWCFGSGRPSKDSPVYGIVPRKSDSALRRRPGVLPWIKEQLQRPCPRVGTPDEPFVVPQPHASGPKATYLQLPESD